jgi:hypothetical protein
MKRLLALSQEHKFPSKYPGTRADFSGFAGAQLLQ